MDPVVEHRILVHLSDPGEPGAVEVLADLLHLHPGVPFPDVADPGFAEFQEGLALGVVEVAEGNALVGQDEVVPKGFGLRVGSVLFGLKHRLGLLRVGQAAGKGEPGVLLVLQNDGALVVALVRPDGFGSEEHRRYHDLVTEDEVVDDAVVPVELPAPRLGLRRFAHEGEMVGPATVAVFPVAPGQLGDGVVQLHDVPGRLQPAGTETGPDHLEGQGALIVVQFLEGHALPRQRMLVGPASPLVVIDGKSRFLPLLRSQGREERRGRFSDLVGGNSGRLDLEETGFHLAIGGDAHERLGERFLFLLRESRTPAASLLGVSGDEDGKAAAETERQAGEKAGGFHVPTTSDRLRVSQGRRKRVRVRADDRFRKENGESGRKMRPSLHFSSRSDENTSPLGAAGRPASHSSSRPDKSATACG